MRQCGESAARTVLYSCSGCQAQDNARAAPLHRVHIKHTSRALNRHLLLERVDRTEHSHSVADLCQVWLRKGSDHALLGNVVLLGGAGGHYVDDWSHGKRYGMMETMKPFRNVYAARASV